ncbi:hypothetical protein BT96DRAFT_996037 [Gymnopus androsaceus JB14]|uniref:Uncharacterized protein n=1 Tax=Gymnopus androsaceus JB14 TaxID=1447944 RepID=A0A6A4HJB9_9AGAR|nr:hypothetical protein BT96DRAFT_996037 [Gymnopus androsaceus JB14]
MADLLQLSVDYADLLQTELYEAMLTAGPGVVPSQTYGYADLNAFAASSKSSADGQGGTRNGNGNGEGDGNGNINDKGDGDSNGKGDGNSNDNGMLGLAKMISDDN